MKQFFDKLTAITGARNHAQLSRAIGVMPSVICRLYSGHNKTVSIETLVCISQKTGIKVSTLAGWAVGETE